MIKAIFFDFYNTLVRFWPPLDHIQQASCQEFGFHIAQEAISYGYSVADVYFNRENEIKPLATRTEAERLEFFSRYEQILLENAGLSVTTDLARQIWQIAISVPKDFIPFDDTVGVLQRLKGQGYQIGVISNLRRDMHELCQNLGMDPYLDFCLTSAEIGVEKPDPAIFVAALERAGVSGPEAVTWGTNPGRTWWAPGGRGSTPYCSTGGTGTRKWITVCEYPSCRNWSNCWRQPLNLSRWPEMEHELPNSILTSRPPSNRPVSIKSNFP